MYKKNNNLYNDLKDKKTNFKNNLDKTRTQILRSLIYENNKKFSLKIVDVARVFFEYLRKIRPNRKFPRKCITPPSKWYQWGEKT